VGSVVGFSAALEGLFFSVSAMDEAFPQPFAAQFIAVGLVSVKYSFV
jgi:hypothetical protein